MFENRGIFDTFIYEIVLKQSRMKKGMFDSFRGKKADYKFLVTLLIFLVVAFLMFFIINRMRKYFLP